MLSESDLALVTALQVAPRASWAAVAQATGLSAATAARHWQHLVETGAAWVTASPGQAVWASRCVAYVEVSCTPGDTLEVAQTLAQDPNALTVEVTAGGADLFLTVAATDLAAMSRYLLQRIDTIPGITRTNSRIATGLYRDGSDWRLDALPVRRSVPTTLGRGVDLQGGVSPARRTPIDRSLSLQLGLDGRATYADLAHRVGVSEVTARRRTAHLIRTGTLVLRTEVAAHRVGWPVSAILSIEVPVNLLSEAARTAARLRQMRLVATVAGSPSLISVAWLKQVAQIHDLEQRLVDTIPELRVTGRLTVLRTVKRMGRILDGHGHAVSAVPMDHWRDPLVGSAGRHEANDGI
ncbi:Lrp/AsnC family transcriptional regulator [Leekyejoonella antrihumi]|nr:Lrp/AsnC family transcriptional regulator [Leekyejoonella antrihumi]